MNNNNNEHKENETDSLFSRFEDALGSTMDGTNDIGTPEDIPVDVDNQQDDNRQERTNPFDKADELEKRLKQEKQNRFNKENKLGDNTPNPSDPNRLHRNQMPRPNNNGLNAGKSAGDAAKGVGDAAKGVGDVAKGAGNLAKGAQTASQAAGTVGNAGAAATGAAGTAAGTAAGGAAATGAAAAGGAVAAEGGMGALISNPVGWVILAIIAVLIIVVIILIFVIAVAIYTDSLTDIKLEDGYAIINSNYCDYVTVTDSEYDGTYPYEEYIAGVITAEVGMFNNDTVNKVFSVAARNFFYNNQKDCTIAGNATKQAYKTPSAAALSAANATAGLMMITNGQIKTAQYDAFAYESEDDNYYYIKQQNQAIPKSWANSKSALINSLSFYKTHKHGNGMSQWGAYYLAEQGKNFDSILKYYYGDITLAKAASAVTYSKNMVATVTPASRILHEPLSALLARNGTSVESVNNAIYKAVNEAGYGTGNGVAAAAYALITIMDQNYGVRLPYAHGGHAVYGNSPATQPYTAPLGADGAWGTPGSYTYNGNTLNYYGIDCNGFMQWAMYNGGMPYKHVYTDAASMVRDYGVTSCNASNGGCEGVPGDLLVNGGHVMMIVGVTPDKYYIAHSSSPSNGMLVMVSGKKVSGYQLVKMSSYYNTHRR